MNSDQAVNKVPLVAAAIVVSIWVIMWLDLPPVFNSPLPAGQKVVVVVGPKLEKVMSLSKVIQSVPDPELATSKDITSTRLKAFANSSEDVRVEVPGWLKVTKKTTIERAQYLNARFIRAEDIARFPKLVEAIEITERKHSSPLLPIYEKSPANPLLAETVQVPPSQAREIVEFMQGKSAEVADGKEYSWAIMFGMSIYNVQMRLSHIAPKLN